MLLYWKYREGNKLLSLSPSTSWYLTCEPDNRGNYMLILFANGVKMMIDDGYMYSLHGPDMDDRDLRSFFNSIIDEVAGVASSSPRIIDLEEIKHNLITTRCNFFSMPAMKLCRRLISVSAFSRSASASIRLPIGTADRAMSR